MVVYANNLVHGDEPLLGGKARLPQANENNYFSPHYQHHPDRGPGASSRFDFPAGCLLVSSGSRRPSSSDCLQTSPTTGNEPNRFVVCSRQAYETVTADGRQLETGETMPQTRVPNGPPFPSHGGHCSRVSFIQYRIPAKVKVRLVFDVSATFS